MKAFFVQCLSATSQVMLAGMCTGLWAEHGAKPFKCLSRPSTLFLCSCGALFHFTSNYFNPVIAPTVPGLTVHRVIAAGETNLSGNVDTSAATEASSACPLPLGLCSSGLCDFHWVIWPKIRCQGISQHSYLKCLMPLDFLVD